MREPVVLFTEGEDTTPEQIVAAWRTLREAEPWLPQWFAAEILQDIMAYLLEQLPETQLRTTFILRGTADRARVSLEFTPANGQPRVSVAPEGCSTNSEKRAVEFRWRSAEGERPRQMVMMLH